MSHQSNRDYLRAIDPRLGYHRKSALRLKAPLPLWRPWAWRHLRLAPAVEAQIRRISARQIDRRLALHFLEAQVPREVWRRGGHRPG